MKHIIISQRVNFEKERYETTDLLDHRLTNLASDGLGCLPFPIPNSLGSTDLITKWIDAVSPIGVIISGGGDIGSCKSRDETEYILLKHSIDKGIPVLGICRGMQLIATYFGGQLCLASGHVAKRHMIHGQINMEVNSYHNYAIKYCPSEFEVTSNSMDGQIESIRHRTFKIEGWMWHPERETINYDLMILMIKNFFSIFKM